MFNKTTFATLTFFQNVEFNIDIFYGVIDIKDLWKWFGNKQTDYISILAK